MTEPYKSTGSKSKEVTIYTDGSCLGNPGPGGYGAVLLYGAARKEISQGYQLTTNNRMELLAAISGLRALTKPCQAILHSDSKYLIDAMSKGWAQRWQANGWRRNAKERAINVDLWGELLTLCMTHDVSFRWVKGHAGVPENERSHILAEEAARRRDLLPDDGYLASLVDSTPSLFADKTSASSVSGVFQKRPKNP